jgi:hypothetical protein
MLFECSENGTFVERFSENEAVVAAELEKHIVGICLHDNVNSCRQIVRNITVALVEKGIISNESVCGPASHSCVKAVGQIILRELRSCGVHKKKSSYTVGLLRMALMLRNEITKLQLFEDDTG